MNHLETTDSSFKSWLFSRHEIVEKTVGLVVLVVELVTILGEIYPAQRHVLTQILNLFFLVFIYFYLKADFAKRFSVDANDPNIARILRFPNSSKREEKRKVSELVFNSNTLISQLKNINYFILFTAGLYVLLISQYVVTKLLKSDIDPYHLFHFLEDLFSYVGAFFLLQCFYVMYLRTVDKSGNDILRARTNVYLLVGFFLMVFDIVITLTNNNGVFISEFVCGLVNAVVFILLIARFENKILDIPPLILCILYTYAILQTCLPFVTGNFLVHGFEHTAEIERIVSGIENNRQLVEQLHGLIPVLNEGTRSAAELKEFLEEFNGIVLTLCLVGKVTLSAVLLYIVNSKRVFYYFMTLRKIHEEEEKHWEEFNTVIDVFPTSPEAFSIVYNDSATSMLEAENFRDVLGLTCKILSKEDPISEYLGKRLSPETHQLLEECIQTNRSTDECSNALAKELNTVLKEASFYDSKRFKHVKLRKQTKQLLTEHPANQMLVRLNRMLLEDVYPVEIAKSPTRLSATIPNLFDNVSGEGATPREAKRDLLNRIRSTS